MIFVFTRFVCVGILDPDPFASSAGSPTASTAAAAASAAAIASSAFVQHHHHYAPLHSAGPPQPLHPQYSGYPPPHMHMSAASHHAALMAMPTHHLVPAHLASPSDCDPSPYRGYAEMYGGPPPGQPPPPPPQPPQPPSMGQSSSAFCAIGPGVPQPPALQPPSQMQSSSAHHEQPGERFYTFTHLLGHCHTATGATGRRRGHSQWNEQPRQRLRRRIQHYSRNGPS